ncbi:MAG: CDP-archaeol synthase [Gammaproteobacteria bacterium]|jgi:hypothetical protein|nr:CDP-archaeol synthase [Gammaproteobacteria bacterium]
MLTGCSLILSLIHLLILILVANGAPIIARNLLAPRFNLPLDFYIQFHNRDLFGPSKTWRGLIASLICTAVVAILLGYSLLTGIWVALLAMAGDVLSSFIKRRLNMRPSSMAPFLDQVPESLLPAMVMHGQFGLDVPSVMILVLVFIALELILSRILYRLGLRKTPY